MTPSAPSRPARFTVMRRRRSFGLDAPRPPDIERAEAAILAWLTAYAPQVFWLRAAGADASAAPRQASTLVLMLPGGRIAILRIETRPSGAETLALAAQCLARRIPLRVVKGIDDARAALRRLGVEPEED